MPIRVNETALTGKTEDGEILSEQEELFCNEYVFLRGNGTRAALKAYDCKSEKVAGVMANENLKKPRILKRVNELVEKHIMTDVEADFELTKLIRQDSDLGNKRAALSDYNKMKGRFEKDNKKEITVKVEDLREMSPDDLMKMAND